MARKANKQTPSTQRYLPISEVRDDCVVLKDGTLRAVLLVSSINFALKSEDEQNAIVAGYVSFLNSLEAPLQIVIQSRQLDLDSYIETIATAEKQQTNDLLRLQTAEYRSYIQELVDLGSIMSKRFYVVITYDPATNKKRGFFSHAGDILSPTKILRLNHKQFRERHDQLFVRIDKVVSGLSSMGLRASVLDTQSLIELYYTTYNPVISRRQPLASIDKLTFDS
ncbi:MAG: hypothetical protein KBB55_00800 [Candidatus Buchananbacteria bacterium]|nr:hypothetical protein [Candidatus Buchananbacteria bacterium]